MPRPGLGQGWGPGPGADGLPSVPGPIRDGLLTLPGLGSDQHEFRSTDPSIPLSLDRDHTASPLTTCLGTDPGRGPRHPSAPVPDRTSSPPPPPPRVTPVPHPPGLPAAPAPSVLPRSRCQGPGVPSVCFPRESLIPRGPTLSQFKRIAGAHGEQLGELGSGLHPGDAAGPSSIALGGFAPARVWEGPEETFSQTSS